MLHDAVVHCKKKRIVRGKVTWAAPQYVRVTAHKVAKGKILKVKSGTQHIDRVCRFLKERVRRNQQVKAGTKAIRERIQAAQYEYWFRGRDLWVCTGHLVTKHVTEYLYKKQNISACGSWGTKNDSLPPCAAKIGFPFAISSYR